MTGERSVGSGRAFDAQVAVVGGGMAGLGAAVAAARAGADVCLLEKNGFLGGTATAGLVGKFQTGPDVGGERVILGLYGEVCERLAAYDALDGEQFAPEMMKVVAFDMCEEAGVRLLLHATASEVQTDAGRVTGASLATRGGLATVHAQTYVDATGDGTLSALAGAHYAIGREADGLMQPMTLIFQLGNLDLERVRSADWDALSARFRLELPGLAYRGRLFFFEWTAGLLSFCIAHVSGADPLDVEALTQAEISSRRQALAVQRFFRQHVPGAEQCVLALTATEIGIRESRRIVGDYVLTREDVLGGGRFEDGILRSTSWIDMHNPEGKGVLHELIVPETWFEVPFRSLLVRGFHNLLVAGRCISATHEAQGAIRTMPTCIGLGQAAGLAAALAASRGLLLREIDVLVLRAALVAQGASL